jgi:microcin C transport system permease protein
MRKLLMPLSPIAQQRWQRFRANRRGFWSLWIFSVLFIGTLGAELIANDRPLLLRYDGAWYAPVLRDYTELDFGGEFATHANYRDPYLAGLINAKGYMIWPPIRYSYDTINYDLKVPAPAPPSADNLLGTDDQGRDVLARVIYGFRISILFGLTLTLLASVIGIAAGAVQGYCGGWLDLVMQRFIEIWSGMPMLYLLIILSSLIQPGFWSLLLLMLLFSWMKLVHIVRAEFLRARNFDYVRAARALGAGDAAIIFRHILPNALVSTLSALPFILSGAVTLLTTLDYMGLGLPPGSASLGELLNQGKNNLQAPWLGFTAFFTIAILLCLLVFIFEALRDAFDTRQNARSR